MGPAGEPCAPGDGAAGAASETARRPPAHFAFSTREVPPEGRFETWRDLWMKTIEVDVSSPSPEAFTGDLEMWEAGPLAIASVFVKTTLYDRTPRLAGNGGDDFSLTLCGHNFRLNGEKRVPAGSAFFLSHGRPFTVEASDDCYSCLLKVERASLLALMPKGFDLHAKTFASPHPFLPLIRDTAALIMSKTEPMTGGKRAATGQLVVDLIAYLLNPSRDGRALIETRGLRAARLGAILQAIDKAFARPGLSADKVGRTLGISGRQVHRLLEETTKTFYEHLLERRLQHAYSLLTDPASGPRRIADVAYAAGFRDITHFNHAFRARFGDTPTGVRESKAAERALLHLRHSLAQA